MDRTAAVFVAGHRGMVGAALVRQLERAGFTNIITRTRTELDLTEQAQVRGFFELERPRYVFLAAARVGGIYANNAYPAEFIYDNLMIEANIIQAAQRCNAERLLFLGSSCIYPREAEQPMQESVLLTGNLEPTNEPYAVAKIAGIKLCESFNRQYGCDFRSVMPTNLYGPGDNFHRENSHVIPALLRRFHDAKVGGEDQVEVWGSGAPRREFLHVDDLAAACLFVMQLSKKDYLGSTRPMLSHINIGTGSDVSIGELAGLIKKVTGFSGDIVFDETRPDGTPRKLLDVTLISQLGWQSTVALEEGLTSTYSWFLEQSALRAA